MCELDCKGGICVNNECVCPANYHGFGEGVDLNGCHLNEAVLTAIWYGAIGTSAFTFTAASILLYRWMQGGGIDWAKLWANRNFKLVRGVLLNSLFFGLTAVVRAFGDSRPFNDPAGTILYWLAETVLIAQCVPLSELCYDLLVGLVKAVGCNGTIPERGWWVKPTCWACVTVPFLPMLISPALGARGRWNMARYNLVAFGIVGMLLLLHICISAEKAIALLASVGTEPTVIPRKRIRFLTLNCYITSPGIFIASLVFATTAQLFAYYPYYIAVFCALSPPTSLVPVLVLNYDRSKIAKRAHPKPLKLGIASHGGSSKEPVTQERSSTTSSQAASRVEACSESPQLSTRAIQPPTKKEPGLMELA